MCQMSSTLWPRITLRHKAGVQLFYKSHCKGRKGDSTPYLPYNTHSPTVSLFHLYKKKKNKNKVKTEQNTLCTKTSLDASAVPSWEAHVSVLVGYPGPRIVPWGLFPSRLSFPQSSEPREPGQLRNTHWTLQSVRAGSVILWG